MGQKCPISTFLRETEDADDAALSGPGLPASCWVDASARSVQQELKEIPDAESGAM